MQRTPSIDAFSSVVPGRRIKDAAIAEMIAAIEQAQNVSKAARCGPGNINLEQAFVAQRASERMQPVSRGPSQTGKPIVPKSDGA